MVEVEKNNETLNDVVDETLVFTPAASLAGVNSQTLGDTPAILMQLSIGSLKDEWFRLRDIS